MEQENLYELFTLISSGTKNVSSRREAMELRKEGLNSISKGLTKLAFDTRRIDQDIEYNPRRGLQYYNRSEKFISEGLESKIKAFAKLAKLLDQLKLEFGRDPEWQDSYLRSLTSSVHNGLRTNQLDGDYSEAQPSMASLAYLEELMFVRYRITPEDLLTMSEENIRKKLLNKDEILLSNGSVSSMTPIITKSDVSKLSYEQMMDKMLTIISALIENKKDNRVTETLLTNSDAKTITITIKG